MRPLLLLAPTMNGPSDDLLPPTAALPPLRVLVVEDNLDAQFLVCEMLRAFGHSVLGSSTGEDALAQVRAAPYDLLFTDVSLPGMSGIDLARQARAHQPGLNVIFATGYGDTISSHVDFPSTTLKKPYELEQLQAALAKVGSGNRVR